MSSEILLMRNGYGSSFNNIYINGNTIRKECKNAYGKMKIHKEINFYKYIIQNKVNIAVPTIYEYTDSSYTMEYLKSYDSLYKVFASLPNKDYILNLIYSQLNTLHSQSTKQITKDQYIKCLEIETHDKLIGRVAEVAELIKEHSHITSVNGIPLESFNNIMEKISSRIKEHIESLSDYRVCIIHGDCQFNNVLYSPVKNDIVFIDPRGYYGDMDLYGIAEYDFAKIQFALSGYDIFDNMTIDSLVIDKGNLTLPNIFQIDGVFEKDDIVSVLTISIWLGNAHCFKHQPSKAMFSYFYAMYLATTYLTY